MWVHYTHSLAKVVNYRCFHLLLLDTESVDHYARYNVIGTIRSE